MVSPVRFLAAEPVCRDPVCGVTTGAGSTYLQKTMGVKLLYTGFEFWLGPAAPKELGSDNKTHVKSRCGAILKKGPQCYDLCFYSYPAMFFNELQRPPAFLALGAASSVSASPSPSFVALAKASSSLTSSFPSWRDTRRLMNFPLKSLTTTVGVSLSDFESMPSTSFMLKISLDGPSRSRSCQTPAPRDAPQRHQLEQHFQ